LSTVVDTQRKSGGPVVAVLGAISFCHLLNDMIQSLLPAVYPILKGGFNLSFAQIGLLTFVYQATASLLQPIVGAYTDRHPKPYSLPVGMLFSLSGLVTIAVAQNYPVLVMGSALLGTGSSIFHPESSRIARLASGGRHGLAQSVFQVGGNFGTALGPLLAAFFVLPRGRASLAWFTLVAFLGALVLSALGRWYQQTGHASARRTHATPSQAHPPRNVAIAIIVLIALIFSKFFYLASITSYYIFYLMDHFHVSQQLGQVCLFLFLASTAVGLVFGGMLGDRFGRKAVIWGSIVGVLPFTLVLPHVGFGWTIGLSIVIGLVLSSAMPAIIVYAQELMPGQLGMVSGLFFGLAFGMGGIGAAALGALADHTSIEFVYWICSFLPLIGMLAVFLPDTRARIMTSPAAGSTLLAKSGAVASE
jgi:MFS transporter, FSR family, fosmidomycin resistance protein